jgi:tetratricopeptide (TPR) repeat protein
MRLFCLRLLPLAVAVSGGCCVLHAQDSADVLKRGAVLARAYLSAEAEALYVSIGTEDVNYSISQSMLGYVLMRRSALRDAEKAFRNALAADPGNPVARFGLGIALSRGGSHREAAVQFEQVFGDPDLGVKARTFWVQEVFWVGREGEALDAARRFSADFPLIPDYQSLIGFLSQVSGDTKRARSAFERAIELDPGRLSDYRGIVSICRSQKDPAAALLYLRRAARLEPNDPLLYEDMAAVYAELGLTRKAEEAREEARRTLDAELLYTQAVRARIEGRRSDAEKLLRECTEANPRLSKAWTDLGEILREAGRRDEALPEFRRALETDPESRLARLGLAAVLVEQAAESETRQRTTAYMQLGAGDYRDAEVGIQALLSSGAESKELLDNLGFARMKMGKTREAIATFESSLKKYGIDGWVCSNLGFLYQGVGDIPSAISNYRRALQLSPNDPEINHNLGFALYLSKDYKSALEPLRTAVRLRPDWGAAHLNLAMDYWNLLRYAEALTHARTAAEKGVPAAAGVVQALSANLSLVPPRSVTVLRRNS